MLEPMWVDNSTLKAAARCSTEALVRYVLGYVTPEERATLRAGTAGHEAMAVHFRGGSKDAAMQAFAESYQAFAEEHVAADDRLSWSNTSRIVDYWLESHPLHALPFKVDSELVEIGFEFPLTEEDECICSHRLDEHRQFGEACSAIRCDCPGFQRLHFCGRLDALANYDGGAYIVENKTTGRISDVWLKQWWLDSQLSGYTQAAHEHLHQPVVGVILNGVEFSKLPGSDRKCDRHAVVYAECGHLHANFKMLIVSRSQPQLAEWRKTALHLARRYRDLKLKWGSIEAIQKVRMQGTFHGACPWCSFFDFCVAGRNPEFIKANFILEPWSPFDRVNEVQRVGTAHKP